MLPNTCEKIFSNSNVPKKTTRITQKSGFWCIIWFSKFLPSISPCAILWSGPHITWHYVFQRFHVANRHLLSNILRPSSHLYASLSAMSYKPQVQSFYSLILFIKENKPEYWLDYFQFYMIYCLSHTRNVSLCSIMIVFYHRDVTPRDSEG